jgi:branched-chain amino acid transport system substrate-binding protein
MKKLTLICFVLIFVPSCNSNRNNEIKIGAILPLTGDAALYGNNAKEGIDLAVDNVNAQGGVLNRKIKIVYEDSKADPKTGVAAFQKLVTFDKVQSIIGCISSSVTLAFAPLAEKNKIVVLSPAATSPKLSEAGKYIFRNWTSDTYEASIIANYMINTLKINKLGILYLNNDYGVGLKSALENEFAKNDKKIIITEGFAQNQNDFKVSLSKIKALNIEALYIISYPDETINILKQIKELNINVTIISTSAFQDELIIKNAGKTAENVIYPYPVVPDTSQMVVSDFLKNFENKYKKKPGIVSDTGYDALLMIIAAMEEEKSYSGESIQKGLMTIKNFHGASGIMSFDKNGDIKKEMKIKTVRNGAFVEL